MKKLLIVNADDFGLSVGTNLGIEKAHREGILTSASLFATTPGFEHALKIAKRNPKLAIGVHLSLTLGSPVLPLSKVQNLIDNYGDFEGSFFKLIYKSYFNKIFLLEMKKELKAQIEKILSRGVKLDHINGQQHFHVIPNIFPIVNNLAKEYKLKIRYPKERIILPFPLNNNLIKYFLIKVFISKQKVPKNYYFYGLLHTGQFDENILMKTLLAIEPGITEILLHPAYYTDKNIPLFDKQKATNFMSSPNRQIEIKALISKKIKSIIKNKNITLSTYSKL